MTRFADITGPHPDSVPVVLPVSDNTPSSATCTDAIGHLEQAHRLVDEAIGIGGTSRKARFEKLIIQIPCFNEAGTIAITLGELPRTVPGFRRVEWLVIDDGSVDSTVEEALKAGVDHVVRLPRNRGLARAFMAGIAESVKRGADVIVNTDADNQYCGADIDKLVQPIVEGRADMVVGARPIMQTAHFSLPKKILQRAGSWVVRKASSAEVDDAPSGFRAMTRETAMRLNVFTDYTYTLETIIQAGQNNMAVVSVPIRTNGDLRPSRLLKSIPSYVRRSASTILRIFMTYRPLSFFGIPGLACCALSALLCFRYLLYWISGSGGGHVQSLILAAILMSAGLLAIVVGLVGDLISVNRKLLEKVDWQVRQIQQHVEALSAKAGIPARGSHPDEIDGAR